MRLKRHKTTHAAAREDLCKPSKWRLLHGGGGIGGCGERCGYRFPIGGKSISSDREMEVGIRDTQLLAVDPIGKCRRVVVIARRQQGDNERLLSIGEKRVPKSVTCWFRPQLEPSTSPPRGISNCRQTWRGRTEPPRSCLGRIRSATDPAIIDAMRRRAWHEHGVVALAIADITDPWLRQAITNEAARRWGPRQGAQHHGR